MGAGRIHQAPAGRDAGPLRPFRRDLASARVDPLVESCRRSLVRLGSASPLPRPRDAFGEARQEHDHGCS
jgi:hypothetical protein